MSAISELTNNELCWKLNKDFHKTTRGGHSALPVLAHRLAETPCRAWLSSSQDSDLPTTSETSGSGPTYNEEL